MPEPQNERWLTYAELGELLNCSASAARMHARRRGWQRRTANVIGEPTRVLVPGDASIAAIQRRGDQRTLVERFGPRMFRATDGQDEANSAAVVVLREQLVIANRRIDELGTRNGGPTPRSDGGCWQCWVIWSTLVQRPRSPAIWPPRCSARWIRCALAARGGDGGSDDRPRAPPASLAGGDAPTIDSEPTTGPGGPAA